MTIKPIPIKQWKRQGKASDDGEVVAHLATLSLIEYDRVRETEAEALGVRVSTLDAGVKKARGEREDKESGGFNLSDPEPWLMAVVGSNLLDDLVMTIQQHMVLPPGAAEAVALWIMHSHVHDTASISPILAVTSPVPECGKTTLLTLLIALVRRPLQAANITAAAVFRAVERWKPSLIVDEADTFLRESDELRGVLNSGHNRTTAFVIRTVGDDHEPRQFRTWAPKAIALIGKLPATLESRAVHVELRRIADGENVVPLRGDKLGNFEPLRRQCFRWACDNAALLQDKEPDMPVTIRGRAADNWRHLLAIADLAGGDWPQRARQAAETLSAGREGKTAAIMLLDDLRAMFAAKSIDRLTSAEIVTELGGMEDKSWPEWWRDKPITAPQVARLLKPFAILPKTIRTMSGSTPKGYHLDQFTDAFRRYLPPQAATPPQVNKPNGFGENAAATESSDVADVEMLNPLKNKGCGGVAAPQAETWGDEL